MVSGTYIASKRRAQGKVGLPLIHLTFICRTMHSMDTASLFIVDVGLVLVPMFFNLILRNSEVVLR
jgi:hypothetical protein